MEKCGRVAALEHEELPYRLKNNGEDESICQMNAVPRQQLLETQVWPVGTLLK